MTLSDFIEANLDGLIDDWTDYARQVSHKESRGNICNGAAGEVRTSYPDARAPTESISFDYQCAEAPA